MVELVRSSLVFESHYVETSIFSELSLGGASDVYVSMSLPGVTRSGIIVRSPLVLENYFIETSAPQRSTRI